MPSSHHPAPSSRPEREPVQNEEATIKQQISAAILEWKSDKERKEREHKNQVVAVVPYIKANIVQIVAAQLKTKSFTVEGGGAWITFSGRFNRPQGEQSKALTEKDYQNALKQAFPRSSSTISICLLFPNMLSFDICWNADSVFE